MEIRFWQIICFVIAIVAITFAMFPGEKILIPHAIEKGDFNHARTLLTKQLAKDGDNQELLLLSAKLFSLEGQSTVALQEMEKLVQRNPHTVDNIYTLAHFYEWERMAEKALATWERIAVLVPDDKVVWAHLIDYYRYFNLPKKESKAISRLFQLENKSPRTVSTPLLNMFNQELHFAMEQKSSTADSPNIDSLLSGLYLWRMHYLNSRNKKTRKESPSQIMILDGFFEVLLRTGFSERALKVATHLDHIEGSGRAKRLQLFTVIQRYGINKNLRMIFTELLHEFPDNGAILAQMAQHADLVGDIPTAMFIYEKLLQDEPDQIKHKRHLATLYLNQDLPAKAYQLYKEIIETAPSQADLDMMLTVAGYTDNSTLLIEAAEHALRLQPDNQEILVKVGSIFLGENRPDRSYAVYRHLATLTHGRPDIVLRMLEMAAHTGQDEIIRQALNMAITLQPEDRRVVAKASEMYLWVEELKSALELLIRMAQWSNGDAEIIAKMIEVAGFSHYPDLQRQAYLIARKFHPNDPRYLPTSIDFFVDHFDLENSIAAYEEYRKLNTLDEKSLRQLAELYEQSEQPLLAYGLYKELYQLHPNDPNLLSQMQYLADWAQKGEDAVLFFEEQARQKPLDFARNLNAGLAFMAQGDKKKGFYFLDKAHEIEPDNSMLRRKLAQHSFLNGNFSKVMTYLEPLKSQGAMEERDRLLLAQAYLQSAKGSKALHLLSHLEKAEQLPRKEGMLLARAYEASGRKDTAIALYKRLFAENQDISDFVVQLGRQVFYLGQKEIALSFYEAALKNDPRNLKALLYSGQLYASKQEFKRAIKRFQDYNRLSPNDYTAHYLLGEAYFITGKKGLALAEYRKSEQLIQKTKTLGTGTPPEVSAP